MLRSVSDAQQVVEVVQPVVDAVIHIEEAELLARVFENHPTINSIENPIGDKFYSVLFGRSGRSCIYLTWADCDEEIKDLAYAKHAAWPSLGKAIAWLLRRPRKGLSSGDMKHVPDNRDVCVLYTTDSDTGQCAPSLSQPTVDNQLGADLARQRESALLTLFASPNLPGSVSTTQNSPMAGSEHAAPSSKKTKSKKAGTLRTPVVKQGAAAGEMSQSQLTSLPSSKKPAVAFPDPFLYMGGPLREGKSERMKAVGAASTNKGKEAQGSKLSDFKATGTGMPIGGTSSPTFLHIRDTSGEIIGFADAPNERIVVPSLGRTVDAMLDAFGYRRATIKHLTDAISQTTSAAEFAAHMWALYGMPTSQANWFYAFIDREAMDEDRVRLEYED
ncbi:hypothetical protein K474DRAFT_1706774 [Panus rudis PR-1116 ss-1]|nr:hypothetical protein K474DRAFT_1706774 [Panus rudis PR-1116 ss-1]